MNNSGVLHFAYYLDDESCHHWVDKFNITLHVMALIDIVLSLRNRLGSPLVPT